LPSAEALDRNKHDAWIPQRFTDYFPTSEFGGAGLRYELRDFPTTKVPCKPEGGRDASTSFEEECAIQLLQTHPDAVHPDRIYKPWVFPYRQLRVGYANISGIQEISFGYVSDLSHLGFSRLLHVPLPGRVAFELLTRPTPEWVPQIPPGTSMIPIGSDGRAITSFVGTQYEYQITNIFGLFGGYFRSFRVHTSPCVPVSPFPGSPPQCFESPSLNYSHLGFYVQIPKFPQSDDLNPSGNRTGIHNLTFFLGPTFFSPSGGTGIYFRVVFDVLSKRGRKRLGDPPAY